MAESNVIDLRRERRKRDPRLQPEVHDYEKAVALGVLAALQRRVTEYPDIGHWYQAAVDEVLEAQDITVLEPATGPEVIKHFCTKFGGFNEELKKVNEAHDAYHQS